MGDRGYQGTTPLVSSAGCHLLGTEHQSLTQKLSETWAASLSHRLPMNLHSSSPGGSARKEECLRIEAAAEMFKGVFFPKWLG